MNKKKLPLIGSLIIALMIAASACGYNAANTGTSTSTNQSTNTSTTTSSEIGDIAYGHMQYLSDNIGARVDGSDNILKAKEYITGEFESIGYDTELQNFKYNKKGTSIAATNIIVTKQGNSSKQIIVAAHYDSGDEGKGADDNASGVAVLLEAAKRMKDIDTPYTIKFIAFSGEEDNYKGSFYYTSQLTDDEINNIIVMINMDSLTAGDKMYIYGNSGSQGIYRDKALEIAEGLGLAMGTNPGVLRDYPAGTTGDWSDHYPFLLKGIPYVYFEGNNWDTVADGDYSETAKFGNIMHTPNDTVSFIEKNYPGRIKEHLTAFVKVLDAMLSTDIESGK